MGLHGHSSSDLPVHRGILQAGFKVLAHPTCHTLIDSRDHPNQCNRKDQICFCRLRVASRYIHTNPESAGKVSSCVSILLLLLLFTFNLRLLNLFCFGGPVSNRPPRLVLSYGPPSKVSRLWTCKKKEHLDRRACGQVRNIQTDAYSRTVTRCVCESMKSGPPPNGRITRFAVEPCNPCQSQFPLSFVTEQVQSSLTSRHTISIIRCLHRDEKATLIYKI